MQSGRRESIEPIPEGEDENESDSGMTTHCRSKDRRSVVARLSMRFQKFAGFGDYRRAKSEMKKEVFVADYRAET